MKKFTDESYAVDAGGTRFKETDEDGFNDGVAYRFIDTKGWVRTEHGFVSAQSGGYWVGGEWRRRDSMLEFIWEGRSHWRTWKGTMYSARYLVTLAKRFAAEIAGAEGQA